MDTVLILPSRSVAESETRIDLPNLPELLDGRWGAGLSAEKMKECVWLLSLKRVAQIAFLEWTGADHLRHTNSSLCETTETFIR
jgi:hypothetical protein